MKKIKVFAFAKFQALLMILVGLLCGILYSFGGLLVDTFVTIGVLSPGAMGTPGLSYGTILAFGALAGMPILFGIIGFIAGIHEAILYNVFARWFGGIGLDFGQKD